MFFLRELAYSRIDEILESGCPCISHSESVSRLISLLYSTESYEALVTNRDIARIVTVRDIMRVMHPERSSVSRIAFRPPSLSLDTPIYDVALKLVENRIGMLPITKDHSVEGVVRQTRILEKMADCEDLKDFLSEDLMVKDPFKVYRDSSVGEVRSLMLKRGISHTPVVDQEGKLRGLVTAKDIVWNFFKPRERVTVGERRGEKPRIFKMDIKRSNGHASASRLAEDANSRCSP